MRVWKPPSRDQALANTIDARAGNSSIKSAVRSVTCPPLSPLRRGRHSPEERSSCRQPWAAKRFIRSVISCCTMSARWHCAKRRGNDGQQIAPTAAVGAAHAQSAHARWLVFDAGRFDSAAARDFGSIHAPLQHDHRTATRTGHSLPALAVTKTWPINSKRPPICLTDGLLICGGDGETRTLTDCSTRPSNVSVYQFRHIPRNPNYQPFCAARSLFLCR